MLGMSPCSIRIQASLVPSITRREKAGERIFINGCCGAVGAFVVQLALTRGAHVSGTCGSRTMARVKAAGVGPVFGYADRAAVAANGKFDAIFDTLSTLDVSDGLSMLKPKGLFIDINPTPRRIMRGMLSRRYKLVFAIMGLRHAAAGQESSSPCGLSHRR